jgi:hypothetical protein
LEFQQLSKSPGAGYLLLDDEVRVEVKRRYPISLGKLEFKVKKDGRKDSASNHSSSE